MGCKAPQAAGVIHGDFEKGFIMAETMAFDDLKAAATKGDSSADELKAADSVAALKSAGKYKMNGKEYVVQDGDILNFKFNTPQKADKEKKSTRNHKVATK